MGRRMPVFRCVVIALAFIAVEYGQFALVRTLTRFRWSQLGNFVGLLNLKVEI